jgi:branched-chain amino acid transport system permease protein
MDAALVFALFTVVMTMGLALMHHPQLGLAGVGQFGIVGFWGVGLYAFGVLYVKIDWLWPAPWPFLISLMGATVAAGLAGLLIGWVISNLDIDGVLVGTLGFAAVVRILMTTEKELTGGVAGLGGLEIPVSVGSRLANETLWLAILGLMVGGMLLYLHRVHRSPYGRLLVAIGANEALARSLGKPTFGVKMAMFAWTSAGMGLLGAMYGSMIHFLTPLKLSIGVTLAAMVGLVVGGSARLWGAIVGVVLTVGLFDVVIQLYVPLPRSWYQQALPVAKQVAYGLLLIVVLTFRPFGALGPLRRDRLIEKVIHE